MTCKTCEFGSNESCCAENSKKSHQDDTECGDWGASLEYFSEIIDNAHGILKNPIEDAILVMISFWNF